MRVRSAHHAWARGTRASSRVGEPKASDLAYAVKSRQGRDSRESRDALESASGLEKRAGVPRKRPFRRQDTVEVKRKQIRAGKIFLNVGGRPRAIQPLPASTSRLTSRKFRWMIWSAAEASHRVGRGEATVGLGVVRADVRRFGSIVTVVGNGRARCGAVEDKSSARHPRISGSGRHATWISSPVISASKKPAEGVAVHRDLPAGGRAEPGSHVRSPWGTGVPEHDISPRPTPASARGQGYMNKSTSRTPSDTRTYGPSATATARALSRPRRHDHD